MKKIERTDAYGSLPNENGTKQHKHRHDATEYNTLSATRFCTTTTRYRSRRASDDRNNR